MRSEGVVVSTTNKASAVTLPDESVRYRGRASRQAVGSKLAGGGGYVSDGSTQFLGRRTTTSEPVRRSVTCSAGEGALESQSGSSGALPRRSPLRTVRATRRGTRLRQAARALRVEVLVSCAGGRGLPAGRMRARGGFGHPRRGVVFRGGGGRLGRSPRGCLPPPPCSTGWGAWGGWRGGTSWSPTTARPP